MNKKIKIIELLNKIANGEEVPKEIKVNGLDFIWKTLDDGAGYFNIEEGHWLEDCISLDSAEDLNTEVEILEDNTEEIEELDTLNAYKLMESPYMVKLLKEQRYDEFMEHLKQSEVEIANTIMKAEDKINELARAVNELRKEKE